MHGVPEFWEAHENLFCFSHRTKARVNTSCGGGGGGAAAAAAAAAAALAATPCWSNDEMPQEQELAAKGSSLLTKILLL